VVANVTSNQLSSANGSKPIAAATVAQMLQNLPSATWDPFVTRHLPADSAPPVQNGLSSRSGDGTAAGLQSEVNINNTQLVACKDPTVVCVARNLAGLSVVSQDSKTNPATVDPKTGGLSLTLAVPAGEAMVVHLTEAPAQKVKGGRHRFSYRTPRSDPPVTIHLTRLEFGDYRLVVNGRRADLSALDNGALDVTVALVTGQTQFVENRVLTASNDGRTLVLGNRRRW